MSCANPVKCAREDCNCRCHPRNNPVLRRALLYFNFRQKIVEVLVERFSNADVATLPDDVPSKHRKNLKEAALAVAKRMFDA